MSSVYEELRIRNPFLDPLVTELIEDPNRYHKMFSERILVGETLQVFQPANIVLLGPQGAGKSMILNLLRYQVLSTWLSGNDPLPSPIKHLNPFLGISINLVRANFHVFGRRSVAKAQGREHDEELDTICAADYLTHYLFREFLKGIDFLCQREGNLYRDWFKTTRSKLLDLCRPMASWPAWYGYYSDCKDLDTLLDKCEQRLTTWRKFLNANIDLIPQDIWETKASMEDALHSMGNALRSLGTDDRPISFFVTIDQYEVLPELNLTHGLLLQRLINSLIKARDPVVFYKIGARTYDWGQELRIWGAESRIEVQRDYAIVNLSNVLMRGEDSGKWIFPEFARDVAYRRIKEHWGSNSIRDDQIELILGHWNPKNEASIYFDKDDERKYNLLEGLSGSLKRHIKDLCGDASPLELRLAGAWALQKRQRNIAEQEIINEANQYPWKKTSSWRKERYGIALLQIASKANARKRYFGWETVEYLSGSNITAFLMLCGEIWDMAAKNGVNPLQQSSLSPVIQSSGIFIASRKWAGRDRIEHIGGRKRFEVLSRLGPAIHDALIEEWAISNPGYSGFSLRESDLLGTDKGRLVAGFIENAVSWGIFEERIHTPKTREGSTRRKWYLNSILSPHFGIPYIRVKEPYYANVDQVYEWIFGKDRIKFHFAKTKARSSRQLNLIPGDEL
jgi:hypothetical protein